MLITFSNGCIIDVFSLSIFSCGYFVRIDFPFRIAKFDGLLIVCPCNRKLLIISISIVEPKISDFIVIDLDRTQLESLKPFFQQLLENTIDSFLFFIKLANIDGFPTYRWSIFLAEMPEIITLMIYAD